MIDTILGLLVFVLQGYYNTFGIWNQIKLIRKEKRSDQISVQSNVTALLSCVFLTARLGRANQIDYWFFIPLVVGTINFIILVITILYYRHPQQHLAVAE